MKSFIFKSGFSSTLGLTSVLSVALLSTSFFVFSGSEASARYCSNCPALHDETRSQINDRIAKAEQAIVEALRGQTGEQTSVMDRQVEAQKRITDGAMQNDAIRLRQEFRAEAETSGQFDPDPMSCILLDMLKNGEGGSPPSGMTGKEVREEARNWLEGKHPAVQEGSTAMHTALLAAQEQFKGVGGVEDPTTDWGAVFDSNTINMEEAGPAMKWLLVNTINPTPPRPVSEEDLKTAAGKARAAERNGIMARNSAASEAVSFVLQMRKAEAGPNDMDYYIENSRYNRPTTNGISELQALDIMTTFNYAPNAKQIEERKKLTDTNWLGRIHEVLSLQARMAYLSLEQDNRMLLALGVNSSNLVPQDGNIGARP